MAQKNANQKIEKRINDAWRTGTTQLTLDGQCLTELPESLKRLEKLEDLNLANNQLSELPEWLGQLENLNRLTLARNQLRRLPESLGQLTKLTSLNASKNHLTGLPDSLGRLVHLETLNLSNNNLTVLPEGLGQITQLQSLFLSANHLKVMPEWLTDYTRLLILDFSANHLLTQPEWFGQLNTLTWLDVSKNRLSKLPESLGRLTQLTLLDASKNLLTELPETLEHLSQLETLNLASNQLSVLPNLMGKLRKLKSLDVSINQLLDLPESLGQLSQLQTLNVSTNQLSILPKWFGQFTQLKKLRLSSNLFKVLPEGLGQLIQLQDIRLENNQLTSIPETLGQLSQLKTLYLGNNFLKELPSNIGNLRKLENLQLSRNSLKHLPESIGDLISLDWLTLDGNELIDLPASIGKLQHLKTLALADSGAGNPIRKLPECIRQLHQLTRLWLSLCRLESIPEWISELKNLKELWLDDNFLFEIPSSLINLEHLNVLHLDRNPLNPELAEAYKQGLDAVKIYLRAQDDGKITLNEAKLILIGEGEVGKSCLLGALRGDPWEEGRPTTHGIEIKPISITDSKSGKEIILNGWDFGGQRVYRPTHQLFFSAPAVYLVVWKPREGPQQGFIREWIQLVKRREPEAKILVVATHGGPQQRQPDIDRQELWDLFGKDTLIDFFFVESKPDDNGVRHGIDDLKSAIARIALSLPEVGRSVPKSFQDVRLALQDTGLAYIPLARVQAICRKYKMSDELARLFVTISHRLGHLIYYEHDSALRDIIVLKPDWLATAISYVLDDEITRKAHGLVRLSRLGQLWNDPARPENTRYPSELHQIFLRLMERFDLSYRVADLAPSNETDPQSLIAQLVPDNRPQNDLDREWSLFLSNGDIQQVQFCRIVDENGQSANAEGLFYQLIVRLHKYSLGNTHYADSVHWQRGLVLDDDYNGRALLEHIGNDVRITVRAPYPERFLAMLTNEVKYLVESFWDGLSCDVMVPCIEPCGRNAAGTGLFNVEKLINSKRKGRPDFPCPVCNEWQNIDSLLRNAPAATKPISLDILKDEFETIIGRLDHLDTNTRRILSKVDKTYTDLLQVFTDEAKDAPRLFSFVPCDRRIFNPKKWTSTKFRLTLWCEHSRKPLPMLNGEDSKNGVYEIDLSRAWFKKVAPYLKLLTGTLSLVLPVVSSGIKLAMEDAAYKAIEEQLDFGKDIIEASLDADEKIDGLFGGEDTASLEYGEGIRAQGAALREFQTLLKAKDPSFGGLVRVRNKRQEFLWVHAQFEKEY